MLTLHNNKLHTTQLFTPLSSMYQRHCKVICTNTYCEHITVYTEVYISNCTLEATPAAHTVLWRTTAIFITLKCFYQAMPSSHKACKIQSRHYCNIYKIWATRMASYDASVCIIVFTVSSYSLYAWVQNHVHVLIVLEQCMLPTHIFYMLHQRCTNFVLWRLIVVDPQSGPCCMTPIWRLKFGDGF